MLRLLYILDKPIQNTLPYRLMAKQVDIASTVIYIQSSSAKKSVESINEAVTKVALSNDYSYHFLPESLFKRFFALVKYIRKTNVLVVYGYFNVWQRIAIVLAKILSKKLILTSDATYLQGTYESGGWKLKLKPFLQRLLYNTIANGLWVPSTASLQYHLSLGINHGKLAVTPYVVDEEMIQSVSSGTDTLQFRKEKGIPPNATVFIFCAKFIERKRPLDVINAFAKLVKSNIELVLIMIGDGPMMHTLIARVDELGISNQVVFPGLVQYAELPIWYTASDVLVFSSEHEPYGLPVNEAMLCGIPVIVSDRIGARLDLVEQDKTGWIYPVADTNALAVCMQQAIDKKQSLRQMGITTKQKMASWSSKTNVEVQIDFFKQKGWLH
jgi:glycosyltransferase involved in cell wall biosynthesis